MSNFTQGRVTTFFTSSDRSSADEIFHKVLPLTPKSSLLPKATLRSAAETLVNEIESQQTFLAAEKKRLGTSPSRLLLP